MRHIFATNIAWQDVSNLSINLVFIAWGLNILVSLTLAIIKVYKKITETVIKSRQKRNKNPNFEKVVPMHTEPAKFGFTTDS